MRIILISNYIPDNQESMIRFAYLLDEGLKNEGIESEIWTPPVLFGKIAKSTITGFGKWLGYIDKYVFFPLILLWRLKGKAHIYSNTQFHICDHSNSPYLKYLPINRSSITCHDVIAIRGGLGYTSFSEAASFFGKILQKWILNNLKHAKSIAFVSQLTLDQFHEVIALTKTPSGKNWRVILNAFNAEFAPMEFQEAVRLARISGMNLDKPFLLHVGSAQPRKNRKLLLDLVSLLQQPSSVNICYAGEALERELLEHAGKLGLEKNVFSIIKPNHPTLVSLYSLCEAFIFPSFSEGFGWPVIEAQACGAPVIASNLQPMPEVSGGAALHADPTNPKEFSNAFSLLEDKSLRDELIKKGFKNGSRFSKNEMTKAYLNLFQLTDKTYVY
jgi:glycosyltransferase involved in cell wall biosynthesis